MTATPTPPQAATDGAESVPQGRDGAGRPLGAPEAAQGNSAGSGAHDGPTVAECAADDKRWDLEKGGE
ncbi:hypothetical protein [Streptomyces sp. NPDC055366]